MQKQNYNWCGAHIGLFTLCAAKNSDINSKIYAFEPGTLNFSFLKNHIEKNDYKNKVIANKLLLGSEYKIAKLYTEDDVSGKNSITNYNQQFKNFEEVKQTTIDLFCKEKNIIPEVIKIDAEGAEIDILSGSLNILKNYHPIIFLSVHPKILTKKNS